MINKKITILNIAEESGFSKSTVSKVLRKEPFVKKSTEQKILKIIEKIGYRPDEIARSLVMKRNLKHIGLIVPDLANPSYIDLSSIIEEECNKRDYSISISRTGFSEETEKKYIEIFMQNRASGIIIATPVSRSNYLNYLANTKFPFVITYRIINNLKVDMVSLQYIKAAKDAINYLIKKNHKRIAFFTGKEKFYGKGRRLAGYKAALKDNNINVDEEIILKDNTTIEGGYNAAKEFLKLRQRPSAIVAHNDYMAIGALEYFYEKNIKVPEEISIMGFDNIKMSSLKFINLTTVNLPFYEIGKKTSELLFSQIESKKNISAHKYLFDFTIIERGTVRKV